MIISPITKVFNHTSTIVSIISLAIFSFLFVTCPFPAQADETNLEFQWQKTVGGSGYDGCGQMYFDSSGNMYLIGCYSNTIDLDFSTNTDSHTSNGDPSGSRTHDCLDESQES